MQWTLRDLLWCTFAVALLIGWRLDHHSQVTSLAVARQDSDRVSERLAYLEASHTEFLQQYIKLLQEAQRQGIQLPLDQLLQNDLSENQRARQ